jgi:hypothetical protein
VVTVTQVSGKTTCKRATESISGPMETSTKVSGKHLSSAAREQICLQIKTHTLESTNLAYRMVPESIDGRVALHTRVASPKVKRTDSASGRSRRLLPQTSMKVNTSTT